MKKACVYIVLVLLSGCGWLHRKPPTPDPAELIVTGTPAGAVLLIDGAPVGQPTDANNRTQVLRVAAGTHVVEVRVGESVTYRENTYVALGEKRVITVLSGFGPP